MTVLPINPTVQVLPELFEPIRSWSVPGVYHRPTDLAANVEVTAGWNPASGETVKLGEHELALRFLDSYFVAGQ